MQQNSGDTTNKNEKEKVEMETGPVQFNDRVNKMMKKMDYKEGFGLGKNLQGSIAPIQVNPNLGQRGLGLELPNLERTSEVWDSSKDVTNVIEEVNWLACSSSFYFILDEMLQWKVENIPDHDVEKQTNFCDSERLINVVKAKNIFNELDLKELQNARSRANSFESIRAVFFMNRAALKMANIDAATNFMFTNIDENPHHKNQSSLYYFADICAGPGGFTEYVLWRKKWHFKGFGLTLKDKHDFRLTDSVCASEATFLPLYGISGDGNICCPGNIEDFKNKLLHETKEGVHFIMGDGGFSVEGKENLQEILSKNIYICQCLVALEVLREHGHFVTKVFDLFTSFSVGLIYLMYYCFEKVCIFKPNSSRPANSERYLICYNFKNDDSVKNIRLYLRHLVNRLWELKNNNSLDILEIVPLSMLQSDENFHSYIVSSNNRLAQNQTLSLQKLATFCRNPTLNNYNQQKLRKESLEYWKIPDISRTDVLGKYKTAVELLAETYSQKEFLQIEPREVRNCDSLNSIISDLSDWHFTPLQSAQCNSYCTFYAGLRSKTYKLQNDKWVKVSNVLLPRGTILFGEWVLEKVVMEHLPSELKSRRSLHVIDALRLGDLSLIDLKFEERQKNIQTFCKAINHEFRPNAIRIRPKIMKKLELWLTDSLIIENSESYSCPLPLLGYKTLEEFYDINSLLLLKTNENQLFGGTYTSRVQIFISKPKSAESQEEQVSFEILEMWIKQRASR